MSLASALKALDVPAADGCAFTSAMDAAAKKRKILGENGAAAHDSTGTALLDAFSSLVRDLPAARVKELAKAAGAEAGADPANLADLVILAFQTRGTRSSGKGERDLFYHLLVSLPEAGVGLEAVEAVLELVPHYGYFKDWFKLLALESLPARLADKIVELTVAQLRADAAALAEAAAASPAGAGEGEKEPPKVAKLSLLGKWLPREKSSLDRACGVAKRLAKAMFGDKDGAASLREYRKLAASLTAALNVPEVLMSAHRFAEIEFAKVASCSLARHRKAFLNEDLKGRALVDELKGNRHPDDADRVASRAHLRAALLEKGLLKGGQMQPHQLVAPLMRGCGARGTSTAERDLADAQWGSMRDGVREALAKAAEARDLATLGSAAAAGEGLDALTALADALPKHVDLGKMVALVDVSGSMSGQPMEVAIALGLLVSELAAGPFSDRVLTFESKPSWVDLSGSCSLAEKVAKVESAGWGGSTDFEAACERILGVAERSRLSPDQIPDLIVFSDMQFDQARGGGGFCYGDFDRAVSPWETHFERITRRFAEVGVKVCGTAWAPPRIIFWNLRGNTRGFAVEADTPNAQMLSGFSPALLKLVLSGADLVGDEEEVVEADGTVRKRRAGPTPAQTLRAALDDSCFDAVRERLGKVRAGPLAEYRFGAAATASVGDWVEV